MIGVNSTRPTWSKIIMIVLGLGLAPFAYYTYNKMSGIPRILFSQQIFNIEPPPKVFTYISKKDEYIVLLVDMPDEKKPVYYQIPWSDTVNQKLQEAFQNKLLGSSVVLKSGKAEGAEVDNTLNVEIRDEPLNYNQTKN